MRPPEFRLSRPHSVDAAIAALAGEPEGTFYAGGTELLLAMKLRVLRPELLVDIKRIDGLDAIAIEDGGTLRIGARATHAQIERDPLVRRHLPALAGLCGSVANVRVRGAGTIGGNLCFAEPHADPPTLLATLEAKLCLTGPGGAREIPADDFILGEFETAREPEELLTAIRVPPPAGPVAYRRFRHGERPSVAVGLLWRMTPDGRIGAARLRVGALGPRPQPLPLLEEALDGLLPQEAPDACEALLEAALDGLEVLGDRHGSADYKRHLAGVLLRRNIADALAALAGREAP